MIVATFASEKWNSAIKLNMKSELTLWIFTVRSLLS